MTQPTIDPLALHPVMPVPDVATAEAMGPVRMREFITRRAARMRNMIDDPLVYGYEPPIWRLCDALLDINPFLNTPKEDEYFAVSQRLREYLGFKRKVRTLLIQGGNRTGKTDYAAKRVNLILNQRPGRRAWALHMKEVMSIDYQQPRIWDYMPKPLKTTIRSGTAYLTYRQQTGFADGKFTLPNGSDCRFLNYTMERTTIEGGELDIIWPDELVPVDWLQTMEYRIASRDGILIPTFTAVDGYTPTVARFVDGAEVVKESIGYMLPRDGLPADLPRAMGFNSQEEFDHARQHGPNSRPEDVLKWITGEPSQPQPPQGRRFAMVPRVLKCLDPSSAVVYFHTADNPFAPPLNVIEKAMKDQANQEELTVRIYGLTKKSVSARFARFNRQFHEIKPAAIPAQGTNYLIVDPASGRNFFMQWLRITPVARYIYREWPGNYEVWGRGYPGLWALPDGKHPDGRLGDAAKPFGFGLLDYKREIARLERWQDFDPETFTSEQIAAATPGAKPGEVVLARYIDSRFASAPKIENDRPVTLVTEFDDIGLNFELTPGKAIETGSTKIDDLLAYDITKPISTLNQPKLYISKDCVNTIFALETWTGHDGNKGACKDPIDCLRYGALLDLDYIPVEDLTPIQHGYYR